MKSRIAPKKRKHLIGSFEMNRIWVGGWGSGMGERAIQEEGTACANS